MENSIEISVMYQFNEKYVPFAATSIVSLLENNKEIDKLTIYILGEAITEESKKMLTSQINRYSREVILVDATSLVKKLKEIEVNDYRGSYATNFKMFIEDFIPESINRLLYLDSDTIVSGSIKDLAKIDMHGNPVAMCYDSMCRNHKKRIGFSDTDAYFNGGVILYDVKCWKEQKCTERICKHLREERSHYMAPDQDLINIVLKGQITTLSIAYNIQPIHYIYSYKKYISFFGQQSYYLEEEVIEGIAKPIINHTFRNLGEFPWHKNTLHPNKDLFDWYVELSMWKEYQKEVTENNDFIFKFERYLFIRLPKSIFIFVFKICYEIFMWKANKDSKKRKNNKRM